MSTNSLHHSPSRLHAAAFTVRTAAMLLDEEKARLNHTVAKLTSAGSGEGYEAVIQRLSALITPLEKNQSRLFSVADVLSTSASLAQLLSEAIARVEPFVDAFPAAQLTLHSLIGLGGALDAVCAREIMRICTPELPTPTHSFSSEPEPSKLSIDALHELALLEAPPEVTELANQNPDLRILEAPTGGLVAVVGDLESADTVTTFVAGVHSSDPSGWPTLVAQTRALSDATRTNGQRSAGILWLGYRAPDDLLRGLQRTPAEVGGLALRKFQKELAERYPRQRRIVTSFSYGTVVAGHAARQGLYADDLVFIGSPGVGVQRAQELKLLGNHPRVHAVVSPGDPIGLVTNPILGVHGPDPASKIFGTEPVRTTYRGGHTNYIRDPTFLRDYATTLQRPPWDNTARSFANPVDDAPTSPPQ